MRSFLQFLRSPAFSFADKQSLSGFAVLLFLLSGTFVAAGMALMYGALATRSIEMGLSMLCSFAAAWALPQWALRGAIVQSSNQ